MMSVKNKAVGRPVGEPKALIYFIKPYKILDVWSSCHRYFRYVIGQNTFDNNKTFSILITQQITLQATD